MYYDRDISGYNNYDLTNKGGYQKQLCMECWCYVFHLIHGNRGRPLNSHKQSGWLVGWPTVNSIKYK